MATVASAAGRRVPRTGAGGAGGRPPAGPGKGPGPSRAGRRTATPAWCAGRAHARAASAPRPRRSPRCAPASGPQPWPPGAPPECQIRECQKMTGRRGPVQSGSGGGWPVRPGRVPDGVNLSLKTARSVPLTQTRRLALQGRQVIAPPSRHSGRYRCTAQVANGRYRCTAQVANGRCKCVKHALFANRSTKITYFLPC